MFTKSRGASPSKAVAVLEQSKLDDEQATPSTLSADVQISGDITSRDPMHIEGEVRGDIRVPHLTIGAEARVTGVINSEVAKIAGTVTGDIDAQTVTLAKTARIVGDVVYDVLSIEAGADLEVKLSRRRKSEPKKLALRKTVNATK